MGVIDDQEMFGGARPGFCQKDAMYKRGQTKIIRRPCVNSSREKMQAEGLQIVPSRKGLQRGRIMQTVLDKYITTKCLEREDMQYIISKPIPKPRRRKFPERYKIHQYWSRKPWYAVRAFIQNYSRIGDLVLDPFLGSGVTCCEAMILNRKAIGIDLNPIAVLISKATCVSPVDLNRFEKLYLEMEGVLESKLQHLYLTDCSTCGASAQIINTIWEDSVPRTIFFSCDTCNTKRQKVVDEQDIGLIRKIEDMSIPYRYPQNVRMPEDSDVSTLDELYSRRNLISLSVLHNEIGKIHDKDIRLLFDLMFSSTLVRSSKLIFINKHRLRKGVNPAGVWGEKRFWVPKEYIENNVLYYFKQRFIKILKAKKETNKLIGDYYDEGGNCSILNQSATDLSNIPDCSVDYCFTDPPYGGVIQYLNLSTIWNSWFVDSVEKEEEIVMDKTKGREQYRDSLKTVFTEIYRVLKPNRYMSVTFHSTDISVWNALIEACCDVGFEIVNVIPQEPLKRSHNQIDMEGTVETDLIITFRKSEQQIGKSRTEKEVDVEKMVLAEASRLLKKKTLVTTAEIYDAVILKWIDISYRTPHKHRKKDISLNLILSVLKKGNFEAFYEREKDYKGEDRKILKWKLPNRN